MQSNLTSLILFVKYVNTLFTGFSLSNKVDQSPPDVIERQGETAKIQCFKQCAQLQSDQLVQTNRDHGFTLMGYLLGKEPYKENDFKDKIEISGDGNSNGYLNIKSLKSNDSAVYFCAAYYTVF